jgi:hypothetical protein
MNHAREEWEAGVQTAYAVADASEAQYWMGRLSLWFTSDFQIKVHPSSLAPFDFSCLSVLAASDHQLL